MYMKSSFIRSVWFFLIFYFFSSVLYSFFHLNFAILDNAHIYVHNIYVRTLCSVLGCKNKYSIFISVVSYVRNVKRSIRNPNGDRGKWKKG